MAQLERIEYIKKSRMPRQSRPVPRFEGGHEADEPRGSKQRHARGIKADSLSPDTTFVSAERFRGPLPRFVFKLGLQGIGYYLDILQVREGNDDRREQEHMRQDGPDQLPRESSARKRGAGEGGYKQANLQWLSPQGRNERSEGDRGGAAAGQRINGEEEASSDRLDSEKMVMGESSEAEARLLGEPQLEIGISEDSQESEGTDEGKDSQAGKFCLPRNHDLYAKRTAKRQAIFKCAEQRSFFASLCDTKKHPHCMMCDTKQVFLSDVPRICILSDALLPDSGLTHHFSP